MAKVTIDPTVTVGRISPFIYGHFVEHLGACIYGGIWVGEGSSMPNTNGLRNDVVAALKATRPRVIRWPGGCFADEYAWRDGVGPLARRPRRPNSHWGGVETNEFGTHEFMQLCRAVGAEPYICGNVGSGTPRELMQWVEYCNHPGGTTLSDERAANGHREPFHVRFWGVGNENWGCGGDFTPEDYGAAYRRSAAFMRAWDGTRPYLIACGPSGNDTDWPRRFLQKVCKERGGGPSIDALAPHYYCGTAGSDIQYTVDQFYELLHRAAEIETLVETQRGVMDEFDPQRRIGLVVDEWGTWHPAVPDAARPLLWQQNTVRDALVAALTLDVFNRHADIVYMSNVAQTVNVLQSLVLTDGARMVVTPTYHVYAMYADHQEATSIGIAVEEDRISFSDGAVAGNVPSLAGSASLMDKTMTVTLTNLHASEAIEAAVTIAGGAGAASVRAEVLTARDIHAHNTFDAPHEVEPVSRAVDAVGSDFTVALPPASVVKLSILLT